MNVAVILIALVLAIGGVHSLTKAHKMEAKNKALMEHVHKNAMTVTHLPKKLDGMQIANLEKKNG